MVDKKDLSLSLVKGKGIPLGKQQIQIHLNKETDDVIKRLAYSCGISKTKMIGSILEKFINDPDHMTSVMNEYHTNGISVIPFKDLYWK